MKTPQTLGFTLLELMIVVVVLGIIAAIAYPSYINQVQKTRYADATSALLTEAQRLERCFTRLNTYDGCPGGRDFTEGGFYTITIDVPEGGLAYTVSAVPAGAQASESKCGTFELTHTGERLPTTPGCWR